MHDSVHVHFRRGCFGSIFLQFRVCGIIRRYLNCFDKEMIRAINSERIRRERRTYIYNFLIARGVKFRDKTRWLFVCMKCPGRLCQQLIKLLDAQIYAYRPLLHIIFV